MLNAISDPSLPILELGAGFGSVTALLPDSTVSVERDRLTAWRTDVSATVIGSPR